MFYRIQSVRIPWMRSDLLEHTVKWPTHKYRRFGLD